MKHLILKKYLNILAYIYEYTKILSMNRQERRKLKSKKKGRYLGLDRNRQTQVGRLRKS